MMRVLVMDQVRYSGETDEQMDERIRRAREFNARAEAMEADFERQRRTPMRSMIEWARARGLEF